MACSEELVCDWTTERCEALAWGERGALCSDDRTCLPALACDLRATPPRCVSVGVVGARCAADQDCGAGLLCSAPDDAGTASCLGLHRSGIGRPCQSEAHCTGGLFCVASPSGGRCQPAGSQGEGEACTRGEVCAAGLLCVRDRCLRPREDGEVCAPETPCAAGLVCSHITSPARCASPELLPEGAPCRADAGPRCAEGLLCGAAEQRCRPRYAAGEVCTGPDWGWDVCAAGLLCDFAQDPSVCVAENSGGAGTPCLDPFRCAPDLVCARAERICRAPLAVGERCLRDDECRPGLRCVSLGDPGTARCTALATSGLGEVCDGAPQCAAGLICLRALPDVALGHCAAPGGQGDPCHDLSDCSAGRVCVGADAQLRQAGACQEPGQEGAACSTDLDCGPPFLCDRNGLRCRRAAERGLDEPCDGDRFCVPGLVCLADVAGVSRCRIPGRQGEGEGCRLDEDCGPGLSCPGPAVCRRLALAGELCSYGTSCRAGLVCALGLGPRGQSACTEPLTEGTPCRGSGECAAGLHCRQLPGAEATCARPGGEGEPCAQAVDCNAGLGCSLAEAGGTCRAARSSGVGAPCSDPLFCRAGLGCPTGSEPRRCLPLHQGQLGDPCSVQTGDRTCARGLVCRAGRCGPSGLVGDPCDPGQGADCAAGLQCHPILGLCTAGEEGQPCFGDVDCVAGSLCEPAPDLRLCVAKAGRGEPCLADSSCLPGLSCLGRGQRVCDVPGTLERGAVCPSDDRTCGPGLACLPSAPGETRCGPLGAVGAACTRSAQCDEGLHCVAQEPASRLLGTCQAPGSLGLGQRCDSPIGEPTVAAEACQAHLACRDLGPLGRCGPPATLFEPCTTSAECSPALLCREGRCQRTAAAGEACGRDVACAAGLICTGGYSGHCVPSAGLPEEVCLADGDCSEDLVCQHVPGGPSRCRALAVEGEPCVATVHCRPGLLCSAAFARCYDPR